MCVDLVFGQQLCEHVVTHWAAFARKAIRFAELQHLGLFAAPRAGAPHPIILIFRPDPARIALPTCSSRTRVQDRGKSTTARTSRKPDPSFGRRLGINSVGPLCVP